MSIGLFILSVILFCLLAWLCANLLNARTLPYLLSIFLLVPSAAIVVLTQILDLFGLLDSIPAFLLGQSMLVVLAGAFNLRRSVRPDPLRVSKSLSTFWSALKTDRILSFWAAALSLAWSFNLGLTFVVPPNNNDALSTHIARIGFWLRNGTLASWNTDRWYQLIYPPNAQLILYWQALFLRSDLFFGTLQWLAGLISGAVIYALAGRLGFSAKAGLAAAFTYLSLPVILFQSTTVQNDLVMAFFVTSSALFAIRAGQTGSLVDLGTALMAGGLGFGVKQTFFFFVPLLFGLYIWAFVRLRKALKPAGWGLFLAGVLIFGFLSGGNKYLENTLAYGNPMGPESVLAIQTNQQSAAEIPAKILTNSVRAVYGAIDPAGLPDPLFGYFHKTRAEVFNLLPVRDLIESPNFLAPEKTFLIDTVYPANEDTAQFGPAALIVLFVAVVGAARSAIKGSSVAWVLLFGALSAFLMLIIVRPGWDEFQARYMIPVLGSLLPYWGGALSGARWPWRFVYAGLALLSLYSVSLYNPAKPVLGKEAVSMDIWHADRVSLMMAQNRSLAGSVRLVERYVPTEAPLGVYAAGEYMFQYPLFGEGFTRDVIPILDEQLLADETWLLENGLDHLLLRVKDGQDFLRPPATYFKVDAMEGWRIYQRLP